MIHWPFTIAVHGDLMDLFGSMGLGILSFAGVVFLVATIGTWIGDWIGKTRLVRQKLKE